MGVGGLYHVNVRFTAQKETRNPMYRGLGVAKLASPPALDPRTVQSVASYYTDWAIRAHVSLPLVFFFGVSARFRSMATPISFLTTFLIVC
jgi:hypothetical protein